jgi:two-component system, NarL family, sensor histidine kinase FusK
MSSETTFGSTALRGAGRAPGPELVRSIRDFQGHYAIGIAALAALYYAGAHLGYAFQFAGPVAAIVWLPAGLGMAFLYLAGLRYWPGVVIGDLLVNNYSALPVGSAVAQTCGNVFEIVVAVVLVRRLTRRSALATIPGVAAVVAAIAAGCAVSATIGSTALALADVIGGKSVPNVWRTWWLGDFTGALIVLPAALAWSVAPSRAWLRGRALEALLLLCALGAFSVLGLDTRTPLSYVVFPALIWAALRFGQRGATVAVLIVSGTAIWGTTHDGGPFVFHSISRSVLSTQLYIGVAALSTLCLAAMVSEREALATRLRGSRARVVELADIERRRLERNLHDGAQQRLVALAAHLHLSAREARQDSARAGPLFESAEAELLLAIDELRALAHGIRPPVLSQFGLAGTIETIVAGSEVPIEVIDFPTERLDERAESTAYFLVMEAITNAQKHAQASRIQIRFAVRNGGVEIEVVDDGVGGAVERPALGLEGLRDRIETAGGRFEIDSAPGRGTRITATVQGGPRQPSP